MNIAIIGSGIGGLATACRLASKGHTITVFEKNAAVGGKISEIRHKGYRFDTGPSLFTLPQLVDDLFTDSGEKPSDVFKYKSLDVLCKYFYKDGTKLIAYSDQEKFKKECLEKLDENPQNITKYLSQAAIIYKLTAEIFVFNSLHRIKNLLKISVLKSLLQVHKIRFYRTMHKENSSLFNHKHLIQLFDRYATYNGSNPYSAPATLNIIGHLENNLGAYFPEKGMYSIVDSLYQLAQKKEVKFKFNSLVSEIVIKEKKATGLIINKEHQKFDIVIANSDVKYLANNMVKKHPLKNRLNKIEPSSSVLVFFWGIKKEFPDLDLHNILFSDSYEEEFKKLFVEKTIHCDPTVYIFASSKLNKADAPENCENWFVLINAPSGSELNWNKLIIEARKNIVNKINQTLKTNIEDYIEFEKIATPQTMEEGTLSSGGALYGNSSNSKFAAFLRHPNFLSKIENLFFVGGSVHPGGGIPLCLASAKIVDNEISTKKNEQSKETDI